MALRIYDTSCRDKVDFVPLKEGQVSLYVCGLTVYDLPHIGHARTFVVFDMFRKMLRKLGYQVTLVRNHTDIDDKIIRRSREEGCTPQALADRMIDGLHHDMALIDVEPADIEPRVTQHIPDIIAFIQKLFDNGHAYCAGQDVYFDVTTYKDYGRFSNRNLDEMLEGVRIELSDVKRNPADFALWKGVQNQDEPGWDSPWGYGRPGWHIECSCMSTKYLSPSFDIHGGGRDLIFPHHENEIAQAHGAQDGAFARHWMHVGMVEINGEKMSHSLKNFWTIRDIAAQVHAEALRYFFLTTHYRHSINFSQDTIAEATGRLTSLYRTLQAADEIIATATRKDPALTPDKDLSDALVADFAAALEDDLNTPKALAVLASAQGKANELMDARGKKKPEQIRAIMAYRLAIVTMGAYVGLFTREPGVALAELRDLAVRRLNLDVAEIDRLIQERHLARSEKNWARSDEIREKLLAMGVQILDKPEGTVWQVC